MKQCRAICFTLVATIILSGCGFFDTPAGRIKKVFPNPLDRQLVIAAFEGDKKKAEKLIQKGANIDCRGWIQTTPVDFAVKEQNKVATQILLELGANPSLQNEAGYSAIIRAADIRDDSWFLEMTIKYGGDVNQDGERETPLFNAVYSLENIKLLVKAGANVNAQNQIGDTVLMKAAMAEQFHVVYYLLSECKADPTLKTTFGASVLYSIQYSHLEPVPELDEMRAWRTKVIQWLKDHNQWHHEEPTWKIGYKEKIKTPDGIDD